MAGKPVVEASNRNLCGTGEKPDVAYVIDPRFPGGTSSAIAQELQALKDVVRPDVYCISSKMFSGTKMAPQLEDVIGELGLRVRWNPEVITADTVILHNPSFLKFQDRLDVKILANRLFVVTHENFTRSTGVEGFDVGICLNQIDRAVLALDKTIAPISCHNRGTVTDWLQQNPEAGHWGVLADDWFNICDFEMVAPEPVPRDRRGRLSRPGFEKFPTLEDMEHCFPEHAESNTILGADNLFDSADEYPHWNLIKYRGMEVPRFFSEIDFMVYFTSPTWRESFGRVLAEAIAAGKIVITDPRTALTFGGAVIGAAPRDVDGIISRYVANPEEYREFTRNAQASLGQFSAGAFCEFYENNVLVIREGAV
jgi:hypothetical protein